jgi:hypothetical protein
MRCDRRELGHATLLVSFITLAANNASKCCLYFSGTIEVIIAVGGEDDKVVLRSVESFDPRSLEWKTLACLPFAVSKHGSVVTGNNQLFMAGGEYPDGSASRSVWRYDPCFDQWQEMASMNLPRSELGE